MSETRDRRLEIRDWRLKPILSNLYSPVSILLVTFALRIYRLDFQPLWWDEGISVYLANQSASTILADRAANVHPPLYFLLLRGWTAVASSVPFAMRYFSVLAGTLCVALMYVLGRRLISRRAGLIAAGILALSPFQIHHAQEARMYPLVTLLALLSTYLLVRALSAGAAGASWRLWVGYTLAVVLALFTHYYAVFVPFFQGIFVFLRYREATLKWVASMSAGAILYAPWLATITPALPRQAAGKVAAETDVAQTPLAFIGRYLSTVAVGYEVIGLGAALAAGLVVALIVLGLAGRGRRAVLPLLYLIVPLGGGLLMNRVLPFDPFPRLLAYAAPAVYLLGAAGLILLWRLRFIGFAATGLALVALVVPYPGLYTERRQPGEDYRPIVATIDELTASQACGGCDSADLVILDFPWQAGYLQSYSRSQVDWWIAPGSQWGAQPSQMARDLGRLSREHRRLVYISAAGLGSRRGQNIEGYLIGHAYLAVDRWYGTNRLLLFGTEGAGPIRPLDAGFGEHIRLTGIAMPDSVGAGDVLPVELHLQATAAPDRRFTIFVHLLNDLGQVAAQRDTEPMAGLHPTNLWRAGESVEDRLGVLIPMTLPAGTYQLELGLYDAATGERLAASRAGKPVGDHLLLPEITVRN